MSFSERLKEARVLLGYTQQQVADAMEITNSTYCGYETGKRQPDVAKIKQLASILKVSGDFLLETGFSGNQPAQKSVEINRTEENTLGGEKGYPGDRSVRELALDYSRLNRKYQAVVSQLAKQLLDIQEDGIQTVGRDGTGAREK